MQHYQTADPILYGLLKEYVRELRTQRPTEAESVLWQILRRNATGVHFRRQHIIGPFIADFCCLPAKLIIELDGGYHCLPDQQIKDAERTAWLEHQGFRVVRFTNEEIIFDRERILHNLKTIIDESNTRK